MDFHNFLLKNNYFSMRYSLILDAGGSLFAIKPTIKLFPWINTGFLFEKHILNTNDFLSRCKELNAINVHIAKELSAIIKDSNDFVGIRTLKWIILEKRADIYTEENLNTLNFLADELGCYGIGLSMLIRGDVDINEIIELSTLFGNRISFSYYMDKSISLDDSNLFLLLSVNNKKGIIYVKDKSLISRGVIKFARKLNIDTVVSHVCSESIFKYLVKNGVVYFEGEYIAGQETSYAISNQYIDQSQDIVDECEFFINSVSKP